tara:strand:+ start:910 stop:1542 length:633 start_codon:yes stop_codon:yes gene_type:complete
MNATSPSRYARLRVLLWTLVGIVVLGLAARWGWLNMDDRAPPTALESASALIAGKFALTDHAGKAVTDETYRGKWLVVFFGYTFCPDVCPTTLTTVSDAIDRLVTRASQVQPLFITVDPQRDTVRRMAEYVAAFDASIVGLTGTPDQIDTAAGNFRAYYARAGEANDPDYLMDHSALLYILDPDGRFAAFVSTGDDVEAIVAKLRGLIDE